MATAGEFGKIPGSGKKKGYKAPTKPERQEVKAILANLGVDPLKRLVEIAEGGELQARDVARIYMELMSYCFPKPKSEVDVTVEQPQQNKVLTEMGSKVLEALNRYKNEK